jgi:hypothetical protein
MPSAARPVPGRLRRRPFGFRLRRDPYAVAPTALTIRFVAACGCEAMEAWEAGTSSIVAVARSAMKRCVAGEIALSSVRSRSKEGICSTPAARTAR